MNTKRGYCATIRTQAHLHKWKSIENNEKRIKKKKNNKYSSFNTLQKNSKLVKLMVWSLCFEISNTRF